MHDFTKLNDEQIVLFLQEHILEFTSEPAPDFPRNIYLGLSSGNLMIEKRESGFAVVAPRRAGSWRPPYAQLVFLFTNPAARGHGEAGRLIEDLKAGLPSGVPFQLLCCGNARRSLFERHGFAVVGNDDDLYEMFYDLATSLPERLG